tara:strand:+ start:261 stop:686 length:426 start_codon:yes stop_codon:yes gene_type:complete
MIQTSYRNDRGDIEQLTPHDEKYWQGPYRYEHFPLTLFKATTGDTYQHPEKRIVQNEQERAALGSAWAETPDEARAICDGYEADMAKAAAEFNAANTKLSAKAQAEALAYDRSTDNLIADVPAPKRGPGRPLKSETRVSPD